MVVHAYELGREDYLDGKILSENPYPVESPDNDEWDRGWQYEAIVTPR